MKLNTTFFTITTILLFLISSVLAWNVYETIGNLFECLLSVRGVLRGLCEDERAAADSLTFLVFLFSSGFVISFILLIASLKGDKEQ